MRDAKPLRDSWEWWTLCLMIFIDGLFMMMIGLLGGFLENSF